MPDSIDDAAVGIVQYDIAVPTHHFHYQGAGTGFAQFIQRVHTDLHDAVASYRFYRRDPPALQVLAQQHTKHGWLHGIGFAGSR